MTSGRPGQLPLSALLSQVLVAFTIEFDNEAEQQIRHRTTRHGGSRGGVWLVSMAMWLNCMRYVGSDPVRVGDVARLARCGTNLRGMRQWGYLTLEPDPADNRPKPPEKDLLARATERGMRAREVWEPLTSVTEQRWRDRFGPDLTGTLTGLLQTLADRLGDLPDCLPILGYGLRSTGRTAGTDHQARDGQPALTVPALPLSSPLPLPWLLARVLLAFAIEYESETKLSLAISANLLRLLDEDGTRIRDLPVRSAVSAEGLSMATGFTSARQLTVIESDPAGGKWKVVRLTPAGVGARQAYLELASQLEQRWRARFGDATVSALRQSLEQLAGQGGADSPLFAGLEPDPSGWRAAVRKPTTLPHYPMVLHRGGYPDGS